MTDRGNILITGASGYLGKLIAAILLHETDRALLLPVRAHHDPHQVRAAIGAEYRCWGDADDGALEGRLHVVTLPETDALADLDQAVAKFDVGEIVHAAGCLDYFDDEGSQAVNVELTRALLERARAWNAARFVYISTAFSSGYVDGEVSEALHTGNERDPTVYTRTKRAAEHLVSASGLPHLIIRPSIVIGDSRDGHYTGKQYGLYQLWAGIERLLCSTWEPEFHAVAPPRRLNLVHQDAFQRAFVAACRELPDGAIINVVASDAHSPMLRELWDLWIDDCFRPQQRFYYDSVDELPVSRIPRRQRALMALASVNMEIGTHPWRFERTRLEALCDGGLDFPHATLESVGRCQELFMRSSRRVQKFIRGTQELEAAANG